MPRPVLALLVAALLAPLATGEAPSPHAPTSVKVEAIHPASAVVEWLPGSMMADLYRVYGLDGTALSLLGETPGGAGIVSFAAVVPSGYSAYAVTGVLDSTESEEVFAAPGLGCIYIQTDPPPPRIHEDGCKLDAIIAFKTTL